MLCQPGHKPPQFFSGAEQILITGAPDENIYKTKILFYEVRFAISSDHLTIVVETEVAARHCHPAVARQPPAQLGVGDAREDLHVVVGDGVGHLVTVRHDLAEILSNVTSHKAFSQILREFR